MDDWASAICRRGYLAIYQRISRFQKVLRIRHGSGAFGKWLIQLTETTVLILDDWRMGAIDSTTRPDLLEIIAGHPANKATIITSQVPVEEWHVWIGDATNADAILDRIVHVQATEPPHPLSDTRIRFSHCLTWGRGTRPIRKPNRSKSIERPAT